MQAPMDITNEFFILIGILIYPAYRYIIKPVILYVSSAIGEYLANVWIKEIYIGNGNSDRYTFSIRDTARIIDTVNNNATARFDLLEKRIKKLEINTKEIKND